MNPWRWRRVHKLPNSAHHPWLCQAIFHLGIGNRFPPKCPSWHVCSNPSSPDINYLKTPFHGEKRNSYLPSTQLPTTKYLIYVLTAYQVGRSKLDEDDKVWLIIPSNHAVDSITDFDAKNSQRWTFVIWIVLGWMNMTDCLLGDGCIYFPVMGW